MSAEEIVSQVDQLAKASGNHTANDSQQGRSVGGQGTGPSSDPKAQKRNFSLAQARHVDTAPLPDQARHDSVLRANPYPEVTDRICRLPLPTLFYRLE
uniref:Uncharacterized protein n=1 Tax=Rhodnius prolixus TaxID=13249 RepID=T1HET6_RHOPR